MRSKEPLHTAVKIVQRNRFVENIEHNVLSSLQLCHLAPTSIENNSKGVEWDIVDRIFSTSYSEYLSFTRIYHMLSARSLIEVYTVCVFDFFYLSRLANSSSLNFSLWSPYKSKQEIVGHKRTDRIVFYQSHCLYEGGYWIVKAISIHCYQRKKQLNMVASCAVFCVFLNRRDVYFMQDI